MTLWRTGKGSGCITYIKKLKKDSPVELTRSDNYNRIEPALTAVALRHMLISCSLSTQM